jgi:endothelin-converting enzyme/putative endopeptidase
MQLLLASPVWAQGDVATVAGSPSPVAEDQPLTSLPYTPGLDLTAMDRTADPCEDFYQYSCGGWMKNNPIPPDQARWDVYRKLGEANTRYLWGILDNLAREGALQQQQQQPQQQTPVQQKLGNYFAACMDEAAIEKRGATPLNADLRAIEALRSKAGLPELIATLQLKSGSGRFFFGFGSSQDFENSEQVIAFAAAGGLGLPDRDYYTKTDERSKKIRAQYEAHIARTLGLVGVDAAAARKQAQGIVSFETALARASLTRVEKRDPHQLANKYDPKGLSALTPGFSWPRYLKVLGLENTKVFNVTEPRFFREVQKQWQQRSLADIKSYLRWHLVSSSASTLSKQFVAEDFGFYGKTLRGIPELAPRWKRCVDLVDAQLGEALGEEYVRRNFSPALKEKTQHMTRQIEEAMADEIAGLSWMSPATKKRALEKLSTVANKVGYPDKWRDYSSYAVNRSDFAGNVERGTVFEVRRQLAKIGRPLDRGEWGMTPQTVNAYYDAQMNDINFPAGVLQPPLYDDKMDAAPNYGNTGGTIGHELIHGFDDEGRQFDAKGNLIDWWTEEDAREFNERAQCIAEQYAQYTVIDDIKINSKLTLGEDVADLGGMILAWKAWKGEMAARPQQGRDGLTPEQRFFVGFAQWACENDRPENQRVTALTDPHSPGKYRINGVAVNLPQFAQAFSCKAGQTMVKEKPCNVW